MAKKANIGVNKINQNHVTPPLWKRRNDVKARHSRRVTDIKADTTKQDTRLLKTRGTAIIKHLTRALKVAIRRLKNDTRCFSGFMTDGFFATVPSTPTQINYTAGVYYNASKLLYDVANGNYRIYAIKKGVYHVSACLSMEKDTGDNFNTLHLKVYKNNVFYKQLCYMHSAETDKFWLGGSCDVDMLCGDFIDIRFSGGTPLQTTAVINEYGYCDIHFAGCNYVSAEYSIPNFL